jgi:hypothetical protein
MLNVLESRINEIIDRLVLIHPDDPDITRYLYVIINLLLEDEKETTYFLKNCDDEKIIYWIAALLDRVAAKFPSYELLSILESLIDRCPGNEVFLLNFQTAINVTQEELLWLKNNSSKIHLEEL